MIPYFDALGDGNRLFVRRAQVGTPLRRGRRVYVAYVIGSGRRRAVSPSLTRAVRRALHERPRSPRLTGVLAELEHELAS